jgi:hypothetical protein
MAKITAVTNGLQGLLARQQINAAIETVETDSTITGDGNVGTELSAATALATKGTKVNDIVVVNSTADLPTPAGGVITLVADTQYLIGDSINMGTDTFLLNNNTAVSGLDSVVSTITYTGTGDLFTMVDKTVSIENLRLTATLGRLFNWLDTSSRIFRAKELIYDCDRIGVFNSTSDSIVRFNNCAGNIATDGIEFIGDFRNLFWDTGASIIEAGAFYNLGTATFDSVSIDVNIITLNGSSVAVSGAAASANINAGGIGSIEHIFSKGTGTLLSGITHKDALWEFFGSNIIPNTRQDALTSMQSNATDTVIDTVNVFKLVAGTWVEESTSQFTADAAGRVTYVGGKDFRGPIDFQLTVNPVSGSNKFIGIKVAKNGTVIDASMQTIQVSATNPLNIGLIWQDLFATGDFIEIFVANGTDNIDVLVSGAVLRVN